MKSYKVLVSSRIIWLFSFIMVVGLPILFFHILFQDFQLHWIIPIVVFCIPFFFAYKLADLASRAEVELQMKEKGFRCVWKKHFYFDYRPDTEIQWIDIESYLFERRGEQFSLFKIKIKDGGLFQIIHNNDNEDKDEFLKFERDFTRKVRRINNKVENFESKIKIGKTFLETNFAIAMAIVGILTMVLFPVIHLIHPPEKPTNLFKAIGGLITIFFLCIVCLDNKLSSFQVHY